MYKPNFQYRHARMILWNVGEACIIEYGLYISALEHVRMFILSDSVLLASHNLWILSRLGHTVSLWGHGLYILALKYVRILIFGMCVLI